MKNKTVRLIVILVFILIILDQFSKILIGNIFTETVGNDYFKIEITKNTGMAFGFNDGNGKNMLVSGIIIANTSENSVKMLKTFFPRSNLLSSTEILSTEIFFKSSFCL